MDARETYRRFFSSIKTRCNSCDDKQKQLKLNVEVYNKDSVEINLINCHYEHQKIFKLRLLFGLVLPYSIYRLVSMFAQRATVVVVDIKGLQTLDVLFCIFLAGILYSISQLIKSEKLVLCRDFGLQLETTRFPSRKSSRFIPCAYIYDVCINEVIENLSIHYILIVRTRAHLFNRTPIIPIFNELSPEIDCLEVVYKHMRIILRDQNSS